MNQLSGQSDVSSASASISGLHHPSSHRSWLEVNLLAIEENIRRFRQLVGAQVEIMPCVKADGYGLGAEEVAKATLRAGATRLVVATCQEGEALRAAGITEPIHILGASLPEEVPQAIAHDLTLSLHEVEVAQLVSLEAVRQGRTVPVHLKIDTGMGRLGVLPEEAVVAAAEVANLPQLDLEGVFMHFADAADEAYSQHQLAQFNEACRLLENAGVNVRLRHAASSSAAILYPESHFNLIRPGLSIYGYHSPAWLQSRFPLERALAWRCVVVQIKDYPSGRSLGYNRTFTTRRPTRVAVLPVGYADGYLREYSNRADVLIHGRRAPVVGMISMDYAMADVTDLDTVHVGSHVTLIGQDGADCVTTEELAEHADTIPYFVTTCIGNRVTRCYLREETTA